MKTVVSEHEHRHDEQMQREYNAAFAKVESDLAAARALIGPEMAALADGFLASFERKAFRSFENWGVEKLALYKLLAAVSAASAKPTATTQENAVSTPALSGAVAGAIKRP